VPTVAGKTVSQNASDLGRGGSIGRYVLLDQLGRGGMGVVYKAYDPDLDRPVALKLMHAEGGAREIDDRLLREAQALARLQHPNVIAVYDVGTFQGHVFIAMEFVQGKTLRQWLKDDPHPRRQVLEIFLAAGEGLLAAHRAGLMHRDFKPDNVIVGNDGRVRVLDFGLARAAGAKRAPEPTPAGTALPSLAVEGDPTVGDRAPLLLADPSESGLSSQSGSNSSSSLLETTLTRAGATVGTPRFMAPEQHQGESADERADQFSFCVALYYALYRSFPFVGTTPDEIREHTVEGRVTEPSAGATVPRWLRQVLLRGLKARPGDRYPSMVELLAALRADPSLVYRRWLGAAAVLMAVASVGVAWRVSVRQQVHACAGADRKLQGVWDDARRAGVRNAFQRSSMPYAGAALATVERSFDRYAHDWVAMHTDACEATQVRKEQSQELLDLRMACLSDRLTQLSTLSELFSRADDEMVARAAQSAQSLPTLDLCADAVALRAPIPPPPGEARQKVEQVRQDLARGHALELAAKYEEALGLSRKALVDIGPVRYAPAQAEAQLQLGNLYTDRGEYAEGSGALQEGFVAALAGRDDEVAARTAIQLIHTLGVSQSQHAEGHRWANIAEALIGRVQQKDELQSLWSHKLSMLLQDEGKLPEALASSVRALELAKKLWGPDHLRVGEYYFELGNVYYLQGKYDDALESYSHSQAIERPVLGAEHPNVAGNMFSIANVYGDRGEHERALAENEKALAILARVQADHPFVPQILNSMGADLLALGRYPEAFEKFSLSYRTWLKKVGASVDTAMALQNMGTAKLRLKAPKEALSYLQQALDMCQRVAGAENAETGQILSAFGSFYVDEKKPDLALGYYRRALAVAEKAQGNEHPAVGSALLGIGRAQLALHAAPSAIAPLERAQSIAEKQGDADELASVRFVLAKALWVARQDPSDRNRAISLATQAREAYAKASGKSAATDLSEVTTWLAGRR
jgi:serine/threonine protein kinase/tetratricopeptide (TPR) repeat protein